MDVDLLLIGFSIDKPHTRMAFAPRKLSFEGDFKRHARIVREDTFCLHKGCTESTMNGANGPHRWTCRTHDPVVPVSKAPSRLADATFEAIDARQRRASDVDLRNGKCCE